MFCSLWLQGRRLTRKADITSAQYRYQEFQAWNSNFGAVESHMKSEKQPVATGSRQKISNFVATSIRVPGQI